MSTLSSSVKSNLNTLYNLKNEFDWIMTQKEIPLKQVDKLLKLKKDMLYSLSCILSVNCKELLSNSFYTNVNNVEQTIYSLLTVKKEKLEEIEKPHQKRLEEAKRIISYIYLIDIVKNGINISTRNEEKLVELKNIYSKIYEINQEEIALNYIVDILGKYVSGLKRLLELIDEYDPKQSLSLENKQEILNIFLSIALIYDKSKIRNKIFLEDKSDMEYIEEVKEYLKFYEHIFLNLVETCKFNLPSFYYQISSEINEYGINSIYIDSKVSYIYNKYMYDIENELKKIAKTRKIKLNKLNAVVKNLISFNGKAKLEYLDKEIKSEEELPSYLKSFKEYKTLNKIVLNTEFYLNKDVEVNKVIDTLTEEVIKNIDGMEYLKGYIFNRSSSIKQMAHFRQYFNEVLKEQKDKLFNKYTENITNILPKTNLKDYNLKGNNEKVCNLKSEVKILEHALEYINDNYREFNSNNLKLYINSVQRRYNVENLYEEINKRRSKKAYISKTKKVIEKEQEYLKSFINKDIIKEELVIEIIDNCIYENDKLKKEILEAI